MPKDPTKNVARYKIEGGQLNEFDFQRHQEEFAEQQPKGDSHLIPGTPPEKKAEASQKVSRKAHTLAKKKSSKTNVIRGASAKKLAARKAAKK